jgi:hypothetical protein
MLTDAFLLLLAALALGIVLAIVHLRGVRRARVPWPAGALHGLLGVGGTVLAGLAPADSGGLGWRCCASHWSSAS